MPTLVNSIEGVADGATITTANSGGASGDAFTLSLSVAGGSLTATSTGPAHGSRALAYSTGATSGAERRGWDVNAANSAGAQYFRFYVDPASLVGTSSPLRGMNAGSTGQRFRVQITAAGVLTLLNNSNVVVWTSAALTAGTQWRVEVMVEGGTSNNGRVRIYAGDSTTTSQDSGVLAAQNFGGPIREVWFGQTNSAANVAGRLDDVGWSDVDWLGPAVALGPTVGAGPVAGGLTDTGFGVGYWIDNGTGLNCRLVVSTASDLSSPVYSSAVVPTARGIVKLSISGLAANTTYHYGVEVGGTLLPGGRGQIVTDPTPGLPANGSVAFGSCQFDSPTAATFTAIRDYVGPYGQVRRFIHMGDLNYRDPDVATTLADVLGWHRTSLGSVSMAPLLARVAMTYCWDNHDYGGTDSDKNEPARAVVAAALRELFPSYPLPASDNVGAWFTYVFGRVRFIQIDPRSQRDPRTDPNGPTKTMLGTEQKAWLKTQLQAPEPVKIVQGNIYWRQDSVNGDRWGSYADEFDEINDFIDANPATVGHVYVIFGDRHALAADDGTTAGTRGRPQAGGAPFQQGSTAAAEAWSEGYYDTDPSTLQAFGLLHITDNGSTITIDYEGKTSADMVTRVSMQTVFVTEAVVSPGGVPSGAAVGTPTVTPGAVDVAPGGIASGVGVGTPTVTPGEVALAPASVPTGASVGTPTITQGAPAEQTVAPVGIPTMNQVGTPALSGGDLAQIVVPVGIPSAAAAGRPMVTRMGADREMAPCAWEVIVACGDDYASFPAELRSRAEMWATEMLWMLSGRRFGTCPVTVRPCQDCSELSYQTFGVVLDGGNGSWVPYLYDGNWSNCGCAGRHSCRPAEEVWLPGPVAGITEVRVDGVLVPASAYRVDDGNWLVRHDGNPWPRVQDLNKPAGQADTWTVTYLRGTPVPTGGKIAAGALAYEFAKACIGGPCRLPQQVQSIVRAGVEMQLVSEDAAEMLTGVSETDQWLKAVNPSKLRQRPQVASLDLNLPRVQTWG